MFTDTKIYHELYLLLETLLPMSCPADLRGLGRLTASGRPSVQFRCQPRPDGAIALTLVHLERSEGQDRPQPNPLIQFTVSPKLGFAEVTRLVHHSDYILEPLAVRSHVRPLVRKITLAYARRWLQQLVTEGYRAVQPARAADQEGARRAAGLNAIPREVVAESARSLQQ